MNLSLASSARSVLSNALPGLAVALVPKCPMCVAAYLTAFSGMGLAQLPMEDVWHASVVMLGVSLSFAGWRAYRRRKLPVFALAVAGATTAVVGRLLEGPQAVVWCGFAVMLTALFWLSIHARGRAPAVSAT